MQRHRGLSVEIFHHEVALPSFRTSKVERRVWKGRARTKRILRDPVDISLTFFLDRSEVTSRAYIRMYGAVDAM